MTLPNNLLRFPPTLIDFENDVGIVGQDHENFPAPAAQPRYDWMLIWFISLLANQSSFEEPEQYREGTLWFDLSSGGILRIRKGDDWCSLAEVISVSDGDTTEETMTLAEWFTTVQSLLSSAAPESTFSGTSSADNVKTIPIPTSLQESIDTTKNRPFVYKNGLLIDPRNTNFCTTTTIELLNGVELNTNDTFTVVIKNITKELFHVPSVVVP